MTDASAVARLEKRRVSALDRTIACTECGSGEPVVFLHGNPTSAYLWRNVMPSLAAQARCLAPDLIGMGESDRLPAGSAYSFADHYRYLDSALQALVPGSRVTLVLHDWGSALGFNWAAHHPERVRGIAYMEAIVRPMSWADWPEASRSLFQALRSPKGEELILEKNVFVERILPGSVLRKLTEAEMDEYRRPFTRAGEDRRPMLSWPRALPIDGEPADVTRIVREYSSFMASTPIPKLFVNAEPGAILTGALREYCRTWPNQTEVTVRGSHFVQEDSPADIGTALRDWHSSLPP
jgi:haloalkane dehalogenase